MINQTKEYLKRARCYHILNNLETAITLAEKKQMSYLELIHYLFEKENAGRNQTNFSRRLKHANLPAIKTFDDFDFQTIVAPWLVRRGSFADLFTFSCFTTEPLTACAKSPGGWGVPAETSLKPPRPTAFTAATLKR